MAEAKDAVRFANDAAVHAFVVQAGATREINSARDAEALPENFLEDLLAYGATIDDIRLRLSTPDQSQREPATSMILKVLKTWNVDPRRAIVIGDQHAVQAGQAAGVEGRLYSGEPVLEFAEPLISRLRDAP
jgi:histidinol phosphatase-like enzyme